MKKGKIKALLLSAVLVCVCGVITANTLFVSATTSVDLPTTTLFTDDSGIVLTEQGLKVNTKSDTATVNGTLSGDLSVEYVYSQSGYGETEFTFYDKDDPTTKVFSLYRSFSEDKNSVLSGVTEYRVEYSVNADFSDPILIETNPSQTSVELYNLYKATKYYVRVTAVTSLGNKYAFSTFETADLGPRTMKIDGIYNVRDLGGYMTESGERTAQGRFFRGGAVSESTWTAYAGIALSEEGKAYMRDVLGIKTDFDLRGAAENLNLTESSIPGADLEYYNVGGYLEAFNNTSGYKKVFSALADESRYPVYMHCTGGADRTGTVSFLINALCGVDEATLIKDYEMTSFSVYGERNSKTTEYDFAKFVARLKTYTGNTLSEKTENYMKSIGLTDTEIYNIRAIIFGKAVK